MPHLEARGLRFHYRQTGQGPNVVLIHGVTGNMAMWYLCGLVADLATRFRVTCYDLRGHGHSGDAPTGYTSLDMAEDLHALMEALRIDSALLVGHSFGSQVAAHAAVVHPHEVGGLVFSDAVFPGLATLQVNPAEWAGWERYRSRADDCGIRVAPDDWLDLESTFHQIAALSPQQRAHFIEVMGKSTFERMMRVASTTCATDVAHVAGLTDRRIRAIRQPVACVYGDASPFLPTCEFLTANLANCRVSLVPDAEHFAFEENPEAFAGIVAHGLCEMAGMEPPPPRPPRPPSHRRVETLMARIVHSVKRA